MKQREVSKSKNLHQLKRAATLAEMSRALRAEIAERKRLEEALRESRRTLSTLMSNLPGMAYRCHNDKDWTMEFVSEGCLELTGYHPHEMIGNKKVSYAQLIHPDDREEVWNKVQTALGDHAPFRLIYRIITTSRKEKWVWEQGRGVFSPEGTLLGLEGFVTDITERRQAMEALEQERDFAESLIETAQVIVLVLDAQGRIVRFNPYMEKVSGYRLEEVQGKDWFAIFLPERDRDRIRELFFKVTHHIETRGLNPIVTQEGHEREIEWSNTTLRDPEGNVMGVLAIGQDITEKTKLQRQLVEKERLAAIGATAARIAHEIGNPLNGMYLTAQLLELRLKRHKETLDDTITSNMKKLNEEISRLNNLLGEFRSLSRPEKYSFRPTALASVIEEVLALEIPRYTALGIAVNQVISADLPQVVVDRDKLKQALLNLCKNAAEAMPQGGTLTVRAHHADQQVTVEVVDTGVGIPDEVEIFEPFSTTKPQGTGLGLMVVRQVVSAHGGTVAYTSEPGRGTMFRVILPLHPPPIESI